MVMLVYQRVMMILQIANDEISSGFSITNQMIWGYIRIRECEITMNRHGILYALTTLKKPKCTSRYINQ